MKGGELTIKRNRTFSSRGWLSWRVVQQQWPPPVVRLPSSWPFSPLPALETTSLPRLIFMVAPTTSSKACVGTSYRDSLINAASVFFKKIGITVKFVPGTATAEDYAQYIDEKTKAIYTESIGNPKYHVADIPSLANVWNMTTNHLVPVFTSLPDRSLAWPSSYR